MAVQWSLENQKKMWHEIGCEFSKAAGTCFSEASEKRLVMGLLNEEQYDFFFHSSNLGKRNTIQIQGGIQWDNQKKKDRNFIIKKMSHIPSSFYEGYKVPMEVAEQEEDVQDEEGTAKILSTYTFEEKVIEANFEVKPELDALLTKIESLSRSKRMASHLQEELKKQLAIKSSDFIFEHIESAHPDTAIVNEIQKALSSMKTAGTRFIRDQTVHNVLVYSSFPPGSNITQFAKRLHINKDDNMIKRKRESPFCNDEEIVEKDTRDAIREHAYGLRDGESEEEMDDENEDIQEGEEDDDEEELAQANEEGKEEAPKKRSLPKFPDVAPTRKRRKDARDLSAPFEYWHAACQLNTNSALFYNVVVPGGQVESHKPSIQSRTNWDLFEEFQRSLYYQDTKTN
jgi:hypothetical protein